MKFCSLTIPNKIVTIRPSLPLWLNNYVRRAIRKRKRAHRKAKSINTDKAWRKHKILRKESVKLLNTSKQL